MDILQTTPVIEVTGSREVNVVVSFGAPAQEIGHILMTHVKVHIIVIHLNMSYLLQIL